MGQALFVVSTERNDTRVQQDHVREPRLRKDAMMPALNASRPDFSGLMVHLRIKVVSELNLENLKVSLRLAVFHTKVKLLSILVFGTGFLINGNNLDRHLPPHEKWAVDAMLEAWEHVVSTSGIRAGARVRVDRPYIGS